VKSSIANGHMKSAKHTAGKLRLENQKKDKEIAEALKSHDDEHNPKGETLPYKQRIYRIKVLERCCLLGFH